MVKANFKNIFGQKPNETMTNKLTQESALIFQLTFAGAFSSFAQNKNKIYFSEFGYSLLTDFFSSDLIRFTHDYDFDSDVNGNPKYTPETGHISFNLYEFTSNKSISIESHITFGFGLGTKDGYITSDDSVNHSNAPSYRACYNNSSNSILTFSAPVFINYNYRLGSIYSGDAKRRFNVGIGIDNIHPLFWAEGAHVFDDLSKVKKKSTPCQQLVWVIGDEKKKMQQR